MIKKRNKLLFVLSLLLIMPIQAFAATYAYGYYGTTTDTSQNPLYADNTNASSAQWTDISVSGTGHGYVVWGKDDGTGHLIEDCRVAVPADGVTPSCATGQPIAFWLVSSDGGEIYATIGHTTNPNSDTVTFTSSSSTTTSSGSTSTTSSSCDACQVFSCPGWSQYMGELQNIQNAIPPAPDWQQVADTFNNTITPSVISDLSNLLGNAPDPPVIPTASSPAAPATPDMPSNVDDHGITPPTGQEDPNLGNSTFSGDDIKNNAPVIQQRDDPTGGFKILDPIANLPSQDAFKANKPTEGDNIAPNPKDTSSDQSTTTGPAPTDGTNTAPKPSANTDTTPITGPTPSAPTDSTTTTGPAPSDSTSTAPTPSVDSSTTAPTPGADTSTAPVPGSNTSTAPTP